MMDARSTLSRMPTPRARRPRLLTSLALAPAAALLVALVGCSGTPEIPDADPAPSAPPLFATEEEALEAATAVYEEYLALLDRALIEEDTDYSGLEAVASEEALDLAVEDIESFRAEGLRISGPRTLVSAELQSHADLGTESETTFYACESIAAVRLLDSTGNDITSESRPDEALFEVVVISNAESRRVVAREIWDGDVQC